MKKRIWIFLLILLFVSGCEKNKISNEDSTPSNSNIKEVEKQEEENNNDKLESEKEEEEKNKEENSKETEEEKEEKKQEVENTKKEEATKKEETKKEENSVQKPSEPEKKPIESNNSSDKNVVEEKKLVSEKTETETKNETGKYGLVTIITETYSVKTYSDGSVEKKLISTDKKYDYSKFKATSKDMEAEAKSVASTNNKEYNEMLNYVNQYRREVNKEALIIDNTLNIYATIRAIEMAYTDKLTHTRPDGRDCFSICDDFNAGWCVSGENIAYGYTTVAAVSEGWKNSPGHYSNMIHDSFKKVGFGKYKLNGKVYWVQLFN